MKQQSYAIISLAILVTASSYVPSVRINFANSITRPSSLSLEKRQHGSAQFIVSTIKQKNRSSRFLTSLTSTRIADAQQSALGRLSLTGEDSIEKYANDIATVLKKLRAADSDPTLEPRFQNSSFTSTWTLADWHVRTSRMRYWNWFRKFPRSRLLRCILPQLSILVAWSALAAFMCANEISILSRMTLPLTPLSLVSGFVAGLLTLRSNQGLDRLDSGRAAFGQVVLSTRDMAQHIAASVYPNDQQLGLLLMRHVALFGWLLKSFLRSDGINRADEDIIRTMLPNEADAEYVLRQRKKPVAVVTRLRQVIHHMAASGQLNIAQELALDRASHDLNSCITVTERIRASPIPPLYTAHTGRLLMFYLFFLPLALRGGNMLNGVVTVITTTAVGFAMLGLDEITHLLEQPFRLMPLYQLSKNSMKDVGDALVCTPPPLAGDKHSIVKYVQSPPYW